MKPNHRLEKNKDYINLSYMVQVRHQLLPYFEYADKPFNEFIKLDCNILESHLKTINKEFTAVYPVINQYSINRKLFTTHEPIDLNLAFKSGLGVIKLTNPKHKGQFFLYDYSCEQWMSKVEKDFNFELKKDFYVWLNHQVKSDQLKALEQDNNFNQILSSALLCQQEYHQTDAL
ncbi:hypothetical protein E3U55_02490 [Filobacillus milosensis]|uniref:Uncharacterized protein n=1 Tax=Filobacillus milosensis TaxID=94137 RepID=A0A4Y8IVQ1_9BACI|nr:hypothetical protein E3U55_02490 [Filobacillus milosensis]